MPFERSSKRHRAPGTFRASDADARETHHDGDSCTGRRDFDGFTAVGSQLLEQPAVTQDQLEQRPAPEPRNLLPTRRGCGGPVPTAA